jgi:hypothetical protein
VRDGIQRELANRTRTFLTSAFRKVVRLASPVRWTRRKKGREVADGEGSCGGLNRTFRGPGRAGPEGRARPLAAVRSGRLKRDSVASRQQKRVKDRRLPAVDLCANSAGSSADTRLQLTKANAGIARYFGHV